MSKRAQFRIDYRSTPAVSVASVVAKPWLLKALSIGSVLDIEVLEKVADCGLSTVAETWDNIGLVSGEGYNISSAQRQRSAKHLLDLPDFELPENGFGIDFRRLQSWREKHDRTTAHSPRKAALYEPPLVIVPQTPGATRDRPKAYLSEKGAVAFSKSFYGYSTSGYRNAMGLARLLYLVIHSLLWNYYFLTHSSRIGASYRTILKEDLDGFPFPNPSALTAAQGHLVDRLVAQLLSCRDNPLNQILDEVDELVFDLYGLTSHDASVVRDTVQFGAPYRSARLPGAHPPNRAEIEEFCEYLAEMVEPFVKDKNGGLDAAEIPAPASGWNPPWRFILLTLSNASVEVSRGLISNVMQEANRTAASRVITLLPQGGILIGLLNQLRFWSRSRARLCGLHIVRQHLAAFRRL